MDMQCQISRCIMDFLVQQDTINDGLLQDLLCIFPLPEGNRRVQKSLILRKIVSCIDKCLFSESIIEFLIQIEELDITEGNIEASEATRTTYCTIAMICIANSFEENPADNKQKYGRAVKWIGTTRIGQMEMAEVAERAGLSEEELLCLTKDVKAGVLDINVYEAVLGKFKALDVFEVLGCYVKGAKEKLGPSILEQLFDLLSTDDKLYKLLGLYGEAKPTGQIEDVARNASRVHVLPRHNLFSPRYSRRLGHGPMDQNKGPNPSSMEQNTTADTLENDSVGSSEKGSPTRPCLPNPGSRVVSPLSKSKSEKISRTHMRKRWSVLEEDTLRTGVQIYGKGKWKTILNAYRDIFVDRTEVNLKDKWRNLTR